MRVISIIFISLFININSYSQIVLACLSEITVNNNADNVTVFPADFLETMVSDPEDYLVSISPDTTLFSSIDISDKESGIYSYLVIQKSTQNTCWGNIRICNTDCDNLGLPPIPICAESLEVIIEERNYLTSVDIDYGSRSGSGNTELDFALRRAEDPPNFISPGSAGFESLDTLDLINDDICEQINVVLQVWDTNGLINECITTVCIFSTLALCAEELICSSSSSVDVAEDEIPFIVQPRVNNVEKLVGFTINGQKLTEYGNSIFGIPKNSLQDANNNIKLEVKNQAYLNGVSTLDIVILLQSILGLNELTVPQIIAGDVDVSGDLTMTRDIYEIQQLILGVMQSFNNDNYFLLTDAQEVSLRDNINPFDFNHTFDGYVFNRDEINEEEGIKANLYKYGDLNQNFTEIRSSEVKYIHTNLSADGRTIDMHIPKDEDGTIGMQFGIKLNNLSLKDVQHEYGQSLKYNLCENNVLKVSMTSDKPLHDFKMSIVLNDKIDPTELRKILIDEDFPTEYISPELYVSTIDIKPVINHSPELQFNSIHIYPNPAHQEINIHTTTSSIGKTIVIYNQMGQIEFESIINNTEMVISKNDLQVTGLKYLQIQGEELQKFIIN